MAQHTEARNSSRQGRGEPVVSTRRRGSGQRCARTPALGQPSTNRSSVSHLSPAQSSLASHTRHPPSARLGPAGLCMGSVHARCISQALPRLQVPGVGRRVAAAPVGGSPPWKGGRGVADTPAARCALTDLLRAVAAGGGLVHMGQVTALAGGCWSQGWSVSRQPKAPLKSRKRRSAGEGPGPPERWRPEGTPGD